MNKYNSIKEIITNFWDNDVIIAAWNERCSECDMDDYINSNEDYNLNDIFSESAEAIRATYYGHYEYNNSYFVFNAYGNLDSFDYWDDDYSPVDLETLIDYIIDNGDANMPTEIDSDDLAEYFVEEYIDRLDKWVKNGDTEFVLGCIEDICEEETFDLLMDDWDDLINDLVNYIEEKEKEDKENNEEN